jgi:hypothetical protein
MYGTIPSPKPPEPHEGRRVAALAAGAAGAAGAARAAGAGGTARRRRGWRETRRVAGPRDTAPQPASYLMSASTFATSVSSVVSTSKATEAFPYT